MSEHNKSQPSSAETAAAQPLCSALWEFKKYRMTDSELNVAAIRRIFTMIGAVLMLGGFFLIFAQGIHILGATFVLVPLATFVFPALFLSDFKFKKYAIFISLLG